MYSFRTLQSTEISDYAISRRYPGIETFIFIAYGVYYGKFAPRFKGVI